MTKLWIVGAEGLLGNAMLKQCQVQGISAIGTGKMQADITSMEAIAAKAQEIAPTHIINCAAYTDVDKAESQFETALQINAVGAQNVAETARDISARLIHISTDFVFDDTCPRPYREQAQPKPVNAYGRSKWKGEQRVLEAYPEACIIRTSWLFGSRGKNFFSSILQWLQVKEKVSAVNDQWGCLTYAPDLARAILDLLEHSGIFHFAHTHVATRFEVAQVAFDAMQGLGIPLACKEVIPVSKEAFPLAAARPTHSDLSTEKYMQATGKRPRHWQEAFKEFVNDAAK